MLDDATLIDIAERFGTPTYVYDLETVRGQVSALRSALPEADLRYAVKANPSGVIVRQLAALEIGAEVITLGELERVVRAGVRPDRILLGGPGQDQALMTRALELETGLVSLDSASQWSLWRQQSLGRTRFLIRVNPGLDPGTHEHLATGAADSKFGLAPPVAGELAAEVAGCGRLAGFHVHAGSQISSLGVYDSIFEVLTPLFSGFPDACLLDLGGGFAVPGFDLAAFATRVGTFKARLGLEVILEPGRFLVAEAGQLLTRALHVKDGLRRHVIADAGMAELLRPALYGAEHPIRVLYGEGRELSRQDVDGPLCENADRLGLDRPLPVIRRGDLLVVGASGAYGNAMASNYASSLRPAEVAVDGGTAWLARRRERPEDLWRLET